MEYFESVQREIARRATKLNPINEKQASPFSGMLVCNICDKHYRRKVKRASPIWICRTNHTSGKNACDSKQIPEETLKKVVADVLGIDTFDEQVFGNAINIVRVCKDNILVFRFKDGTEITKHWKDNSRAMSWTDEMKKAAQQKVLDRRKI